MATEPGQSYQRILIIKPSSLGDLIHALPVLAALRDAYPRAHIAWLVNAAFAPLLEGHPLLDEVIPFDRRRYGRLLRSASVAADFVRYLAYIRRRRFELVVDLQGLFRSGFLARASGARVRLGLAEARELAPLFYTHRVRCPPSATHAVDKNLCLLTALGLGGAPPLFPLGVRPDELRAAQQALAEAAGRALPRFTAVLPGARWPSKLWPPQRWAELIERLEAEAAGPCVLLGAAADRAAADRLLAACRAAVIDLVGRTTLRQLVALVALAERVICHDSGPMHVAAALNKPIVAIFGPTNPARTGPYCRTARVVRLPLACSPCYGRICPLGHHACMRDLSVEAVLSAVRELGAEQSPRCGEPPCFSAKR